MQTEHDTKCLCEVCVLVAEEIRIEEELREAQFQQAVVDYAEAKSLCTCSTLVHGWAKTPRQKDMHVARCGVWTKFCYGPATLMIQTPTHAHMLFALYEPSKDRSKPYPRTIASTANRRVPKQ